MTPDKENELKELTGVDPMEVVEAPVSFDTPKMEGELKDKVANDAATLPRYMTAAIPRNPPARQPASTDNNGYTAVDQAMGKISDYIVNPPDGLPMFVLGDSCSMACIDCTMQAQLVGCDCRATCIRGPEPGCLGPAYGWSNDRKTMPKEMWESQCNAGGKACSDCMDKTMVAEMESCAGSQVCLHRTRQKYSPHEILQESTSCYRVIVKGGEKSACESFLKPPPPDNGWRCFGSALDCDDEAKVPNYEDTFPSVETPSVWESVTVLSGK